MIGYPVITDPRVLLAGLAAAGGGAYLFFMGFRWQKEKSLIENTPTSKVRALAMGPVEVFGEALPSTKGVMRSPLSNKDCVYYRYTIEEYRRSGKSSRWVTISKGEKRENFYLQDDTGQVLIDPEDAKVDVPMDFECDSSVTKDPPQTVKSFLSSKGMSFESFFGINKRMRFREYIIAPKDKVYIFGTAGDNPFVEEGTAQKHEADIMISKGKSFYYISDKSEKEVLASYKWKVIGGLFGGGALILVGLAIAFLYLRVL